MATHKSTERHEDMMPLLLLFVAVPLIEIALFIQLGSVLDLGWILLIVVLTAILGTYLVRKQGRDVLAQLNRSLQSLSDPTGPLAHGAMILFSGALLLTPGFFTDTIGFLLLVPAVREAVYHWLRQRIKVHSTEFHRAPPRAPGNETVIDAEYEDLSKDSPRAEQGPSGWTRH